MINKYRLSCEAFEIAREIQGEALHFSNDASTSEAVTSFTFTINDYSANYESVRSEFKNLFEIFGFLTTQEVDQPYDLKIEYFNPIRNDWTELFHANNLNYIRYFTSFGNLSTEEKPIIEAVLVFSNERA